VPRKRCSTMRESDGEPTTRIVVLRNSALSVPAEKLSSDEPRPRGRLLFFQASGRTAMTQLGGHPKVASIAP
jgi:hypothetical protein